MNTNMRPLIVAGLVVVLFSTILAVSFTVTTEQVEAENREKGLDGVRDEKIRDGYSWFRSTYLYIKQQRQTIEDARKIDKRLHQKWNASVERWHPDARERHEHAQEAIEKSKERIRFKVSRYNERSNNFPKELFRCGLPYKLNESYILNYGLTNESKDPTHTYVDNTTPVEVPPPIQNCTPISDELD